MYVHADNEARRPPNLRFSIFLLNVCIETSLFNKLIRVNSRLIGFHGVVVNEKGDPLPGATYSIDEYPSEYPVGADGTFMRILQRGEYVIQAQADGKLAITCDMYSTCTVQVFQHFVCHAIAQILLMHQSHITNVCTCARRA